MKAFPLLPQLISIDSSSFDLLMFGSVVQWLARPTCEALAPGRGAVRRLYRSSSFEGVRPPERDCVIGGSTFDS